MLPVDEGLVFFLKCFFKFYVICRCYIWEKAVINYIAKIAVFCRLLYHAATTISLTERMSHCFITFNILNGLKFPIYVLICLFSYVSLRMLINPVFILVWGVSIELIIPKAFVKSKNDYTIDLNSIDFSIIFSNAIIWSIGPRPDCDANNEACRGHCFFANQDQDHMFSIYFWCK